MIRTHAQRRANNNTARNDPDDQNRIHTGLRTCDRAYASKANHYSWKEVYQALGAPVGTEPGDDRDR